MFFPQRLVRKESIKSLTNRKLQQYLSFSIYKNVCFIHIKFRFFIRKKLRFFYDGEQLLIHLMRPATKEEKITHYDVDTLDTILV